MKRHSSPRLALLLCLAVFVLTGAGPAGADEYDVKAAFLYNFTKFVEWPETAFVETGEPFVLAVLGDDPFGDTLDEMLAGKSVGNRPLVIRRYGQVEALERCHLLFVCDNMKDGVPQALQRMGASSTLTVADFDESVEQGVMIGFRTKNRKVRFDINAGAADARSLKISSKLLTLAGTVIDSRDR